MIARSGLLFVAGAATLLNPVAVSAAGCNFPSTFDRRVEAEFQKPAPLPPIAGGIRIIRAPPTMIRPQVDMTLFVTPSVEDNELVTVRVEAVVDGTMFQQGLKSAVIASSYWNSLTSKFASCENRIYNPDITFTGYSNRTIDLWLDVVVERHVCGPGGSGFKLAGAHLSGPIHLVQGMLTDPDDGTVYRHLSGLEATAGPFSVSTSSEQDFFFDVLQATPLGMQAGLAGYHYDNLKGGLAGVINGQVAGQRHNVTKEFHRILDGATNDPFNVIHIVDQDGNRVDPFMLRDVQFVRGPTGGLSFKLFFEHEGELRSSVTCAALRRKGFVS